MRVECFVVTETKLWCGTDLFDGLKYSVLTCNTNILDADMVNVMGTGNLYNLLFVGSFNYPI